YSVRRPSRSMCSRVRFSSWRSAFPAWAACSPNGRTQMTTDNTWDLYVLEFARSQQQPWVDLISGMLNDGRVDLPFSFVLARQGNRNVWTGTASMQDEHSSGFSLRFGVPRWVSPVRMLAEAGVAAEEVTDVVLTHAHFDHMGSISQFPNAQIYIQK